MERILVETTLDAPIEQVFAILTDHENYKRFVAVAESRLIEHGQPDKNGLGAIREIHAGLPRFVLVEEIRAYEPPTRFEYRIIRFARMAAKGFRSVLRDTERLAQELANREAKPSFKPRPSTVS